ncbi:MAG: hypothetical protein E6Q83_07235 [Thiothrix sp.]|nr:MAG: hypothetical protein E6Q83_07235 [Thiothrix sp.]
MGFIKTLTCLAPLGLLANLLCPTLGIATDSIQFTDSNFAHELSQVKQAQVTAVPLDNKQTVNLELEQLQIFAPDAQIRVHNSSGIQSLPLPHTSYFKGKVSDQANSAAFIAADSSGSARSIIQIAGQTYVGSNLEQKTRFAARALDPAQDFKQKSFECGIEGRTGYKPPLPAGLKAKLSSAKRVGSNNDTIYSADLVIETDYEFYSLFNNATTAAQYITDLIAYVSSIYEAEIKTKLRIKEIVLYADPNDPWEAQSTSSALTEVQTYYLVQHPSLKRTAVHFLSGKENLNGGIAYIDSICTAPSYAGAKSGSYDFGVSGGLGGSFTPNSPLIVWDAYVLAHELGHNFGSSHTHAYDIDQGYALPIDCCYAQPGGACQNYPLRTELPGLGTLTGGTTATHPGTIMSYCHLVSGGSHNLSMSFGKDHPYGIDAYRVPQVMRTTVEYYAEQYPECLALETKGSSPYVFSTVSKWHESFVSQQATPLIGDFNGDQLEDVASFAQYSSHKVFVALSTGNALTNKNLWKTQFALGDEPVGVGDFNGDGKSDLIIFTHNEKNQLYVALSTGTSFAETNLWFGLKTAQDGQQVLGDFNGDGKDDVATVQKASGKIFVHLSSGSRFRVQRQWASETALDFQQVIVGDFNGDHQADLGFSLASGEFKVSLSTGASFSAATVWHSNLVAGVTQLVVGDFNADGKDDIASYVQSEAGGIYLALAEDGKFGTNQKAHPWFAPYDQIIKAGRLTRDQASDLISFTRGSTGDIWVASDLQQQ